MLNFDFLEKKLGIVSPTYFVYDFSRETFHMLYSINWRSFIAWLPLLIQILDNMAHFGRHAKTSHAENFQPGLVRLGTPLF